MTTSNEQKELLSIIDEMKKGSLEEMWLITKYSLEAYFKSLCIFGPNNRLTMDCINIIKEMFRIIMTERKLLNYVASHISTVDINSAEDAIGSLDNTNDSTVKYYYDLINDIEDACELQDEHRGYRPTRKFPTLINGSRCPSEVIALSENMQSIKEFLGYEEAFFTYIGTRICEEDSFGVTPILDDNGCISDLKITLPKIINLDSSLESIMILRKAYDLYNMLGEKYKMQPSDDTKLLEEYIDSYLHAKTKKILGLKNVK